MWKLTVALIIFSASAAAVAGTIFKCKDSSGVMQYQERPCEKETQMVRSWVSTPSAGRPLILSQGQGGHYFVHGSVNGNHLNFLLDTGATTVAIPLAMAKNAELSCRARAYLRTGNGVTKGCTTIIEELKFGHFKLKYVDAVLMPNLSQPLLGMNVLKKFKIKQDNGEMRLSRTQ